MRKNSDTIYLFKKFSDLDNGEGINGRSEGLKTNANIEGKKREKGESVLKVAKAKKLPIRVKMGKI